MPGEGLAIQEFPKTTAAGAPSLCRPSSSTCCRIAGGCDLDEAGLSARQIADHLGHDRPSLTRDVHLGRGVISPEAASALQRLR